MTSQSSIGPTTAIRGNVQGDGDLEILGRVEGSVVMTGDVTIGEGALIQSDVRGRRVVVRGAVAGNISGEEAVILEPGARVVGDLGAPQIGIHAGALVRGNVTTGAPLAAQAAP
ncbi:bactofilin family protein, partial [Sorangium cellulosum]